MYIGNIIMENNESDENTNNIIDINKKKTDEFIIKAKKVHGDKYDYADVLYDNAKTKIKIKCNEHGIFEQTPDSHIRGAGCQKCGILDRACKRKLSQENFVINAEKTHGKQYDYTNVFYVNAKSKIKIKCNEHGIFEQTPDSHVRGTGCPKCGKINTANKLKSSNEDFITKAQQIHNNKYDYSKVRYKNNCTKVEIICKIHGSFEQTPSDHLTSKGCLKCGRTDSGIKQRKSKENFITDALKTHREKYDYSEVDYKSTNIKVKIICKIHGVFEQTPHSHMRGQGCSKCGIILTANKKKISKEEFIIRTQKVHNNMYDYSKIDYENINTKIKIICRIHGVFEQKPIKHLKGQGCPKCSNGKSENTMNEILKEIYLENTFIKIRPLWLKYINGSNLEIDSYCEELKIGFEYQGAQHEKFIPYFHNNNIENFYDQQKRDIWKKEKCKEMDIKLICIPSNYSYQNKEEMKQFIEQSLL